MKIEEGPCLQGKPDYIQFRLLKIFKGIAFNEWMRLLKEANNPLAYYMLSITTAYKSTKAAEINTRTLKAALLAMPASNPQGDHTHDFNTLDDISKKWAQQYSSVNPTSEYALRIVLDGVDAVVADHVILAASAFADSRIKASSISI